MKILLFLVLFDLVWAYDVLSWRELQDRQVVKQRYDFTCGAASLATILEHYYGLKASEEEILAFILQDKEQAKAKEQGLSFFDLSKYAKSKNFKPVGLMVDFQSLTQLKVPAIVFLRIRNTEHFSVLRGFDLQYAYLADSSFGNIKMRIEDFKEAFYVSKQMGRILVVLSDEYEPKDGFLLSKPESSLIERWKGHLLSPAPKGRSF